MHTHPHTHPHTLKHIYLSMLVNVFAGCFIHFHPSFIVISLDLPINFHLGCSVPWLFCWNSHLSACDWSTVFYCYFCCCCKIRFQCHTWLCHFYFYFSNFSLSSLQMHNLFSFFALNDGIQHSMQMTLIFVFWHPLR